MRPEELGIGKLFEHIRDAATVADARIQQIVLWNPAASRIFGYSASEALRLRVETLVPEPLKIRHREGIARYAVTGQGSYIDSHAPLELPATKKSGEEISVELSLSPISSVYETDGGKEQARFVLAIVRDITRRKQAEEELRRAHEELDLRVQERTTKLVEAYSGLQEREARYRSIFDSNVVGIFFWDAGSNVLSANDAFLEMLDYSREDLQRGRLDWHSITPEEYRPLDDEKLDEVLDSGRCEPFEKEYFRKDGSRIPVLLAPALLKGYRDRGVCFSLDLTRRKQAEETLRESEERFRLLVEGTREYAIFMLDTEGRVISWNPGAERNNGYKAEEIIGKHFSLFYTQEDLEKDHPAEELRVAAHKGRYEEEGWRVRKDGTRFWASVLITALRNEDGTLRGFSKVVRDITRRKRDEEKLQRSLASLLALHKASQVFSSTLELREVGRSLLEITRSVSGASAAAIHLRDNQGRMQMLHTLDSEGSGPPAHVRPGAEMARQRTLKAGEYQRFRLRQPEPEKRPLEGLCLPLKTRNQVIGVLEVYGPQIIEEESVVELLGNLAGQAANTLENARLYEELAERKQQLQNLVERLLAAHEEERRRIAYEVHDGLAQVTFAAHQHLQAFASYYSPGSDEGREELDQVLELMGRTVREARQVIAGLRPTELDDYGLAAAIRSQVEQLRTEGWQVGYEETLREKRLPVAVETALYRVSQQALANVRKHARSTRVRLKLKHSGRFVQLVVRDWGRGFDTTSSTEGGNPGEKVGLVSMRERVSLLGGDFKIYSRPGAGTLISAKLPLSESGEEDESFNR